MRARCGMVLLEVMLGTVILAMAGVALVTLLTQTMQTVRNGRSTEQRTMDASRLLNRATLWSTSEFAVRLGRQRVGAWTLEVAASQPELYTLIVRDTVTGSAVLQTTVYRPVQTSGP